MRKVQADLLLHVGAALELLSDPCELHGCSESMNPDARGPVHCYGPSILSSQLPIQGSRRRIAEQFGHEPVREFADGRQTMTRRVW